MEYGAGILKLKRFEPQLILFLLCGMAGRVGLAIHPGAGGASLAPIAVAIACSAIVLWGYSFWWPTLLAVFAAYAFAGFNPATAGAIALGTTLEVLAGAYFLRHIIGFNSNLIRMRDNVGLLIAALIMPIIGTTFALGGLVLFGGMSPSLAPSIAGSWWSGETTALLVLCPLLLKWLPRPIFQRTRIQYGELFFAIGVVLATALFIFWTPDNQFAYYVFIPLTWMALRTGPRGMSISIFIVGAVAVSGTLVGMGPYAGDPFFQLELFLVTLSGLFLIFTSVVEERKNAQQELGRHVEELEQALSKISSEDEAKKNFLAILAHELRNPLAAMLSSIELLGLQRSTSEEGTGLVQTIGEHVQSMRSMLDDVLDISRISRNKLSIRKEAVPLEDIVHRSVESARTLIRNRHHELHIQSAEDEILIHADPIRIEQVVVNLLNNAAKYTNQGGTLTLTYGVEKDMAVIRLRDNGLGISKAMQKRIFEPFFQIKRGKLATEGLGIGLPLTRQLVEMHGGTIEAKSEGEGKGSEFTVRLPLAVRDAHTKIAKPATSRRTLRSVKNKRTILVVDDNETAANALARLLELRGHDVHVAYTGLGGVEATRQQQPDLLILDIGLPDIDGYEVVRRLQSGTPVRSAIIALTGYGQLEDKERALATGFHHHLTKPVGLKELERAFKKVEHIWAP